MISVSHFLFRNLALLGLSSIAFAAAPATSIKATELARAEFQVSARHNWYNILDHAAVADGKTLNSVAINTLISKVSAAGGGTVYVPPGTFLTGTIYLKSHVTLHLENGAVLLGSIDISDYPENQPPRPTDRLEYGRYSLIYAAGQEDVALTGFGKIYGQGDHPNFTKKALEARGWSGRDAYLKRPFGLCFVGCRKVRVENITLQNIAFWCQDYLDCDDVVVTGVTVDSQKFDYNNDGIDIDGCRNVRVSNCRFFAGDDAICLKASYRDCENITVTNCSGSSLANGIKFGTSSNGGFKNIAISNITLDKINAAGIALEIVDGGTMDGVAISNIAMREVGGAIFIRLGNAARRWTSDISKPAIGVIRNVSIDNVVAKVFSVDTRPLASSLTGLPGHSLENISLSNIMIETVRSFPRERLGPPLADIPEQASGYPEYSMFGDLPAYGFYVRHVKGLTLSNVNVRFEGTDYRSALAFDDVQDLEVDALKSRSLLESAPVILMKDVSGAVVRNTRLRDPAAVFIRTTGKITDVSLTGNQLGKAVPISRE